jgi:hypothetical protein
VAFPLSAPLSAMSVPDALGPAFWTSPGDPTGLSSPLGRAVILVGILAALVVTLRWWWHNRRR